MNKSAQYALTILAIASLASGCSVEERSFAGGAGGGSGGGDGGSSVGGGGGVGGGADACAKAFACDDFESQTAQQAPSGAFSAAAEAGEVTVDDTRAFSGKQSVKLSTQPIDGFKAAMLNYDDPSKLPTPQNAVFGRMMFYLESVPMGDFHWTFIVGRGKAPIELGGHTVLYRYGGQHAVVESGQFVGSQLMANYETPDSYNNPSTGPSTDCWNHSDNKVIPVAKWTCAEWLFDGATNEMQFWLDGVELPDLHVVQYGQGCTSQPIDYVWAAPAFAEIFVGWESYGLDETRTIWIDDLAVGPERLGCP